MSIAENVENILNKVDVAKAASSYSNQDVQVIAVTKYVEAEKAAQVVEAGIHHLAENRTDLFLEKYKALENKDITWHLIGNLQRRKVKDVINLVDYFHALDSVKLAKEIEKRAEHPIKCFLEVNISGEETKHGFAPEDIDQALAEISQLDNVEIVGLMTMAPIDADNEQLDNIFASMKQLQIGIVAKKITNIPCTELSMGMSRDYTRAIQQGATFVRIGTAFFE
ncbi:YggS family pyridoxal phosphate-dependent enzyme [Lactococcus formosensis]|uniref:YggS family pyridoxal phosphate-dependent enzyme n=1 Tax=Lactococcus formosensis TaxID=1281486 RepID=UPI001F05447C|nr:YggS family pyridoxal phosphate-dependent enzyme [Lactococcus formosensis]MCH1723897.1 YggS family pyridoxal phosphate-dependent enzyme [Lactococcus formosensis]MDG6114264.1 YggS family pyridoxal phosphate-dependent enzyme [Lactococcus formosensis]MDG6116055.1 YggS family pyridoxal phosphate-dependent enzyme [Lactococcus formosensis]MDG6122536.1 YggS family pyridoxal phosphate-dependent enzyme [Lactococcus formosensis]MDG6124590.1 YggS family pyridoxal phosphate-dependent enzyme [Lactococcu